MFWIPGFHQGLLPFSVFGWPEKTADLDRFYPTSVLITGFDILFFWVARMVMMGKETMGVEPFKEVYFNSLVRDSSGQKMSKSKGNVMDPRDLMDIYGADALRFTLSIDAAPGTDISLSENKLKGYRSFLNKLWNATRFVLVNVGDMELKPFEALKKENLALEDRWIMSRLQESIDQVTQAIEQYRFHEACQILYHFTWSDFCDWYIELAKPRMEAKDANVLTLLVHVLGTNIGLGASFCALYI